MPTPIIYRKSPKFGQTYSYEDIASGTGYVEFFLGEGAGDYMMSNTAFYSDTLYTESTEFGTATFTKELDLDFDVLINQTRIMKGKAFVNIPHATNPTGTHYISSYVIVKIRKWDGTTETEIVSGQSKTVGVNTSSVNQYFMAGIVMDVPETIFKYGDYIRITVEVWGKEDGANGHTVLMAHDPKGRNIINTDGNDIDWGTNITIASALLPFRIFT